MAILKTQVDTGAMSLLISHETYPKLWPRNDTFNAHLLWKTKTRLKFYAGIKLEVPGSFQIDVPCKDQEATQILIAIARNGPSLLGCD